MEIRNNDEIENSEVEKAEQPNSPEEEIGSEKIGAAENSDKAESREKPINAAGGDSPFMSKLKKFGRAAWAYIKHAKMELIVIAALIIADLVTKALVAKLIPLGDSVTLIPNFLYFTFTLNDAAAFGGLFGLEKVLSPLAIRIILLIITTIAIGVFCYLMYRFKERHKLMRLSLALILAGAIGNYIDRLFLGEVRDFIHIVYFGKTFSCMGSEISDFAIFNVADAALTVGVVIFIVYFIFFFKDPKPKESTLGQMVVEPASEENKSQEESAPTKDVNEAAENKIDSNMSEKASEEKLSEAPNEKKADE